MSLSQALNQFAQNLGRYQRYNTFFFLGGVDVLHSVDFGSRAAPPGEVKSIHNQHGHHRFRTQTTRRLKYIPYNGHS